MSSALIGITLAIVAGWLLRRSRPADGAPTQPDLWAAFDRGEDPTETES